MSFSFADRVACKQEGPYYVRPEPGIQLVWNITGTPPFNFEIQ